MSRKVAVLVVAAAAFCALCAPLAQAHSLAGHVIAGSGTTNYGNQLTINSTDLPGRYGTATYAGTTIPLTCVSVRWYVFAPPSHMPSYLHGFTASGSAAGHTYYFSISASTVFPAEAVVQKDTGGGSLPCGFSPLPWGTPASAYEHGGSFFVQP